jgi:site-specific DNA-methyltransferase (adenine-specific)
MKAQMGGLRLPKMLLPAMTSEYIDACCREVARALMPSGYLMLWQNAFGLVQGHHLRIADVLSCVDLIAWDNQAMGMGYRARRRGDYLVILQKQPIKAKATWRDHGIPDRWVEKIDRKLHPHIKPIELTKRLIGAVTEPGDLVVDPAAGSFMVMHAAHQLGREFVGCDLAFSDGAVPETPHQRAQHPKATPAELEYVPKKQRPAPYRSTSKPDQDLLYE